MQIYGFREHLSGAVAGESLRLIDPQLTEYFPRAATALGYRVGLST